MQLVHPGILGAPEAACKGNGSDRSNGSVDMDNQQGINKLR